MFWILTSHQICDLQIFSTSYIVFFILLSTSFVVQNLSSLMYKHLFIFAFY